MSSTETVPAIDVWGWTAEKAPSLESMLATKAAVLTHPPLWKQLNAHVGELRGEGSEARIAGLARWMLAQYHRAWTHLESVSGDDPVTSFARAECCLKAQVSQDGSHPMRRPDLAVKLLKGHPERKSNPRVQSMYLEALFFDHAMDAARKAYDESSQAFKDSADGAYADGRIAEEDGDYRQAYIAYKRALERDPGHRAALLRLAFQLDLGGDDEEAMEHYRRLMALRPLDAHSLINYGVLLEDHGRFDDAMRCYQSVISVFPNHARARAYLRDAQASLDMVFDEDSERRHDKRNQLLRIPISDFELSVRARNCLSKMNIETLGDLVQKSEAELLAYKNFGETSLGEIKQLLDSRGLRLGMNLKEDPLPLQVEGVSPDRPRVQIQLPPGVDPGVLNKVLADLELSVRCRKALAQLKAVTVGDLLQHTEAELLTIKNFGQTSLNELKGRLSEYGVALPQG
jgi:DNA-directed RNA polymerase subunit alpha